MKAKTLSVRALSFFMLRLPFDAAPIDGKCARRIAADLCDAPAQHRADNKALNCAYEKDRGGVDVEVGIHLAFSLAGGEKFLEPR